MRFHLQAHLDNLHVSSARKIASKENFVAWQTSFREALAETLGIAARIPTEIPQTELLSRVDRGIYIEEKHVFMLDDVAVPMYLLIPKTAPPYHAIMAFHGHAPSVHQILGNYPDDASRQRMIAQDENFAQRFAEDGYFVCAIEQQGFGERVTAQVSDNQFQNSCRHLSFAYMMQGQTLLGERVRDAIAAINYVQSRDDVINMRMGCTGHSGGSTSALFLSALDTRLTTTVISGYFCDYRQSILGMHHCECNYVPNLLSLGTIGEIAALIAPRALCIVNGKNDPIFPIAGVDEPYQTVQSAYEIAGEASACRLHIHDGGHRYDYSAAYPYFQNWLNV